MLRRFLMFGAVVPLIKTLFHESLEIVLLPGGANQIGTAITLHISLNILL